MLEIIENHNLTGLTIGLATFFIIGLFHPLVIKAEFYFGVRSWWIFFIFGVIGAVISVLCIDFLISTVAGVFAFSSFWSIREIFQQAERVRKGWFPKRKRYD